MKRPIAVAAVLTIVLPCVVLAGGQPFPTPELVGTWAGRTEIFGPYKAEAFPSKHPDDIQSVTLTIKKDGTVAGVIGKAVFRNARIHRNRGWLGRKLNLKTDFIVRGGRLVGKVTPRDPGTDCAFTIPFNIRGGKTKGTIMLLPKFPLTRPLNLEKQESNP